MLCFKDELLLGCMDSHASFLCFSMIFVLEVDILAWVKILVVFMMSLDMSKVCELKNSDVKLFVTSASHQRFKYTQTGYTSGFVVLIAIMFLMTLHINAEFVECFKLRSCMLKLDFSQWR